MIPARHSTEPDNTDYFDLQLPAVFPYHKKSNEQVFSITQCYICRLLLRSLVNLSRTVEKYTHVCIHEIGHFRVLSCLCFKTSLSAKPFI